MSCPNPSSILFSKNFILVVETGGHRQRDTQIFKHKHRTLWLRGTVVM